MIHAIRLSLIFALAAFWLHDSAEEATACSCSPVTPAQAFDRADTVFTGSVKSLRVRRGLFGQSSVDPATAEFEVTQVWKGPREETMTIKTVRSEVSCGFEFRQGLEYLVYAREGKTGLCDRTALTLRASDDLSALGEGWKPAPTSPTALTGMPTESSPLSQDIPRDRSPGNECGPPSKAGNRRVDVTTLALLIGAFALGIRRRPRL